MKFLSYLSIALLVGQAFAVSEGGEHHASIADLLYPAINFVILFGFLFWKMKKPMSEMFKKSAKDVQEYFDVAKEKDKEAEVKLAMYKEKMSNFEAEAERVRKEAEADARRFDQAKEQETNAVIEKMIQDAALKVENEKNVLMRELNASLVDEVINKTKNIIAKNSEYKNKATEKLISQFQ